MTSWFAAAAESLQTHNFLPILKCLQLTVIHMRYLEEDEIFHVLIFKLCADFLLLL